MILYRLIYIFTVVAMIFFYILYPPWISWYLLILLLLFIPLDILVSLPGMRSKGLILTVPFVVETGEDANFNLIATHRKSYPIKCIFVKVRIKGDDFSFIRKYRCPVENGSVREVKIETSHSGLTTFEIKRFWTVSLIGLFSLPVRTNILKSVLILPPPVKPVNSITLQRGILLRPKPVGGFSEEHDMRVYRPGDPVRSIHWKLSAKFDSLIIREPLVSPPHSRLIHIMKWDGIDARDLTLGRLRWVSDYMLKRRMPFYIKYDNAITISEVKQKSDLHDYLHYILGGGSNVKPTDVAIPARFTWIFRVDAEPGTNVDTTSVKEA